MNLSSPNFLVDPQPVLAEHFTKLRIRPSALQQTPRHVRQLPDVLEALDVEPRHDLAIGFRRYELIALGRHRAGAVATLDEVGAQTDVIDTDQFLQVVVLVEMTIPSQRCRIACANA